MINNNSASRMRNNLNPSKYLIDDKLHFSLQEGKLYNDDDSTNVLYLVMFRVLNNKDKSLVYNYISYSKMFSRTLIFFLATWNKVLINTYKEPGNFLCVWDNSVFDESDKDKLFISKLLLDIDNMLTTFLNSYYPTTIEDVIKFINKLTLHVDVETMSKIVDIAFRKDYNGFIEEVLNSLYDYNRLVKMIKHDDEFKGLSIINGCLFVVQDLDNLVKHIRFNGYNVNGGPQSSRAQVNSINNFLSILDHEYRKSLYNHNNHHIVTGNLDPRQKLSREKFSFNNVHMNLGGVRWSSTFIEKRRSIKNKNDLLQVCYQEVGKIIEEKNVIPLKELQLRIENLLFDGQTWFNDSKKVRNITYNSTTYNFISNHKSRINKLLSNPKRFSGNLKIHGTEYIPWFNKILSLLGSDKVSDMLIQYFLYIVTNESLNVDDVQTPGIPSITCYGQFGQKIIMRYLYERYNNVKISVSNPNDYTFIDFKNNDTEYKEIYEDTNFFVRVGGFFIYALLDCELIKLQLENKTDEVFKVQEFVRLTTQSRKIMVADEQQKIFTLPSKLPMISPPKEYSLSKNGITYGGYLLNGLKYINNIFIEKIGYGKPTVIKDRNIIVDLINGLSRTPYKINIDTLNFIYKYGVEKDIIIDTNKKEIKDILKDPYKFNNKKTALNNRSIVSKVYLQENILNIAELFSNVEEIFFPVRMDNRTRIYCITDYFDYQKNDLAKGLISFATPGKVYKSDTTVIKYFKAFGANMFGNNLDKKSLNHRVDWIDSNSDRIINFENNDIVNKSENKTCFTSFCFEYKRFIDFLSDNESKVFYTYLPIQLDASCNGYQHLTLLTREKKLFDVLNLATSSHDDDPDDFYTYILDITRSYMKLQKRLLSSVENKSKKDLNLIASYSRLLDVYFDRRMVKKTIMTKSYNASIPTQVSQLIATLEQRHDGKHKYYIHNNNIDIKLKRDDIVAFVMAIKSVIAKESPRINELSKYLDSIISICTKLNFPVPWVLPSGAEIRESYEKEKSEKFKAFFFVNTKYTFKSYQRESYDLRKQKRATMPNLIHSLDATTIAILYNSFKSIGALYTIHDCFGVTANNVPRLILKLKLAYIQLYSSTGYLKEFDEFVKTSINKTFKDDVYKLNDNFIYLPNKNKKPKKVLMPDINSVLDNSVDVNSLKKSANIVI